MKEIEPTINEHGGQYELEIYAKSNPEIKDLEYGYREEGLKKFDYDKMFHEGIKDEIKDFEEAEEDDLLVTREDVENDFMIEKLKNEHWKLMKEHNELKIQYWKVVEELNRWTMDDLHFGLKKYMDEQRIKAAKKGLFYEYDFKTGKNKKITLKAIKEGEKILKKMKGGKK